MQQHQHYQHLQEKSSSGTGEWASSKLRTKFWLRSFFCMLFLQFHHMRCRCFWFWLIFFSLLFFFALALCSTKNVVSVGAAVNVVYAVALSLSKVRTQLSCHFWWESLTSTLLPARGKFTTLFIQNSLNFSMIFANLTKLDSVCFHLSIAYSYAYGFI